MCLDKLFAVHSMLCMLNSITLDNFRCSAPLLYYVCNSSRDVPRLRNASLRRPREELINSLQYPLLGLRIIAGDPDDER